MPKINGNEITPGAVISHDNGLWVAVKSNAVKPGKGGAFNQVELKNLYDARKLNERFRADKTIELELEDFNFLYARSDTLIFMDLEPMDKSSLPRIGLESGLLSFKTAGTSLYKCTAAARSASGFRPMLP